ncbi:MAG: alanine racemase, partial [Deltaproteobacteria bacterium]
NFGVIRGVAAPARVLAVVKADGYGHGAVPLARRLASERAAGFGVALAGEGIELREAGIGGEIVVLNGVYGGAHGAVLAAGLTPVVYDLGEVEAFARVGADGAFAMHLKLDTGMSRLGVPHHSVDDFLDGLERYPGAQIEGVMTHLAAADTDPEFTREQLRRFDRSLERIRGRGHRPQTVHIANSAGAFLFPEARRDLVRTGIALYGYAPGGALADDLRPAMRWRTEIIALRDLAAGATVGYDRTFRVTGPLRLATVPVGYGDGLIRRLGNRGSMLVAGVRCPIVGRVSMDLTTLDVTAVPGAQLGDEAVILGAQGAEAIDAEEVAAAADTISYEVLTNVSRRVPRLYL